MAKQLTTTQFFRLFPNDETCLKHLFETRFGQGFECPSCKRASKWFRLKSERAYSCQWCGYHLHPTVGTPFEQTRTPLQLWFYAIHLFTTTRHGVSAKELERQLGVTYKTAWRMAQLIRQHMADVDGDEPLGGPFKTVQVDETFVGGYQRDGQDCSNKTIVFGMVQKGGELITQVVPNRRRNTLQPIIAANVKPYSEVHTDEHTAYMVLGGVNHYWHKRVNHSAGEYVAENGASVNAVENFWRHLKCSIKGTHTSVSSKYLGRYVKEFEYRFNRRNRPETMLAELLSTFRPLSG